MKTILLLLLFILSTSLYAGTCTTTSRTNYSVGQVLTSSALNADLNQLVTKSNGLDGGCVTDGTLEAASLNATDFAAVTNGIHQGCTVSYSDANTVSVDKCILSVNGNFVKTATASTVTWGCTSCASEVVSTQYYVYAKTGSTGATLNLLISTTAPNGDGYDALGDRALGRFYNDSSSAIKQGTVHTRTPSGYINPTKESFYFTFGNIIPTSSCSSAPCSFFDQPENYVSKIDWTSTGNYRITFNRVYTDIRCIGTVASSVITGSYIAQSVVAQATSSVSFITQDTNSPYNPVDSYGTIHCEGY